MSQTYGVILSPQSPPSLLKVLDCYIHYADEEAFVLSRSVVHVGNFVELDTLENDNTGNSRKTLVPYIAIVAIVELEEGQSTLSGFLG